MNKIKKLKWSNSNGIINGMSCADIEVRGYFYIYYSIRLEFDHSTNPFRGFYYLSISGVGKDSAHEFNSIEEAKEYAQVHFEKLAKEIIKELTQEVSDGNGIAFDC